MDIVQEEIGNLNKVIKLKLTPEDYKSQYESALNKVKKEISMPGFRPGKVPKSLVVKKYGKSVLAEEINKIINDNLYKFIGDNKMRILGQPIPKESSEVEGDWDNPKDFNFEYEIGLMPDLDLDLEKFKLDYYKIKIDDKLIQKEIEDLSKRFGAVSEPEVAGAGDFIIGTLVELDDNSEILAGGIMKETSIRTEAIEDKKTAKSLIGVKAGEKVVINPFKVWNKEVELSNILEISLEELNSISDKFEMQIKEIKHLTPAKIDQDLYDKAFGKDVVKTDDELHAKIKEVLAPNFERDQDYVFKNAAVELLLEKIKVDLPDAFMKKWIQLSSENPVTAEQVEADYDKYAKGLKWQLIENEIIKQNEIKVSREEMLENQKNMMAQQYAQYGFPLDDEMLEKLAMEGLQNKEESQKLNDHLYNLKITQVMKDKMKVKEKEVSMDKFVELATGK